jgi:rubrerythrin
MKLLHEAVFTVNTEIAEGACDEDLIRLALSAELSAINLYKGLADRATSSDVKILLLDLAKEEQVHAGELQYILEQVDTTESYLHQDGRNEAFEKVSK